MDKEKKLALMIWALRVIAPSYKTQIPYNLMPYEFAQDVLNFAGEDLEKLPDDMDAAKQVETEFFKWYKEGESSKNRTMDVI